MSINILTHTFEGPFSDVYHINNQSGVYVILGSNEGDNWHVIDVGESAQLKTRIENHDRKTCWSRQNYKNLSVAILYVNESCRMKIETQIRHQFNPPCGDR